MIKALNNFTRKSWNNYCGPDDKFNIKNIIFGYNGKGKSSLAQGIYQSALDSGDFTNKNIRIFNNKYVKSELTFKDDQSEGVATKIHGVIANFGKKAVETDEKIDELRKKVINIEPIESNKQQLENEIRNTITRHHNNKKGDASIQQKTGDILNMLRYYQSDLENAIKIEPDENKLAQIKGDNVLSKKMASLETIKLQEYSLPQREAMENIENIFKKTSYNEIDIPSLAVIEWISTGLELHKPQDKCHFCGNEIDYDKICNLVEEFNANEKQKDTKTLQSFNAKLTEIQNTIAYNNEQLQQLSLILDDMKQLEIHKKTIDDAKRIITSAKNIIEQKIQNIEKTNLTCPSVGSALEDIKNANSEIITIINTSINQFRSKVSKRDALVKGSIALDIKNDSLLQKEIENYKTSIKQIQEAKENNKETQEQIQKLLSSKTTVSTFASFINGILNDLNINLALSVSDDNKNYVITHSKDTAKKLNIDDISEGEKNLLAILFFYYSLFIDSEQNTLKNEISLIIIDDPITSLDDTNSIYITGLVEHLLDYKNIQVFILTHSWDFFTNISYHYKESTAKNPTNFAYFEVKKDINSASFLTKTKTNITPYHHNFKEVYEFSQRTNVDITSDCETYHMPNIIRQVLEGFLSFKVKKSNPTKNNEAEIARALFNKELPKISPKDKVKLTTLLLLININSHKSSRNPSEILESAKFLMNRIEQVDPQHFNAYKTA